MGLVPELCSVQFEPDEEHVEHDTELGDGLECGEHLTLRIGIDTGNEPMHGLRRDRTQQRWTEQNPGHDFTDHRRLPEETKRPTEQKTTSHHGRECGKHVGHDIDLTGLRGSDRDGTGWCFWREERFAEVPDEDEQPHGRYEHEDIGDRSRPTGPANGSNGLGYSDAHRSHKLSLGGRGQSFKRLPMACNCGSNSMDYSKLCRRGCGVR